MANYYSYLFYWDFPRGKEERELFKKELRDAGYLIEPIDISYNTLVCEDIKGGIYFEEDDFQYMPDQILESLNDEGWIQKYPEPQYIDYREFYNALYVVRARFGSIALSDYSEELHKLKNDFEALLEVLENSNKKGKLSWN